MKLTEEQIEIIQNHIRAHQLDNEALEMDLLDHVCSYIESVSFEGTFEEQLSQAILEVAPKGLDHLKKQSKFLVKFERTKRSKMITYVTGYFGLAIAMIGLSSNLLGFREGSVLFTVGGFILLVFFVPLYIADKRKLKLVSKLSSRIKWALGWISTIILISAVGFKIMHLMGAAILLIVGTLLFTLGFLPLWFYGLYEKSVKKSVKQFKGS